MRRIFLSLFFALVAIVAGAQERLVVQGVGELVGDDFAPRYAVLTEKYYNSMEWMALNEKIDRYISAHAFDTEVTEDDPLFDWKAYIANMEEAIESFTKEGNEEMARAYRESLEEAKKYKEEMEQMVGTIKAEAAENAEGLDRQELLDEVLKHAVGGRLWFYAESYGDGRFAAVREKFIDEQENAVGLMDARGKMVIPARYESLYMRDWANNGKNIVLAYRVLSWENDKWEVSVFREDGTRATTQTFAGAKILDQVELFSVRFQDGSGWGVMDGNGRVITQRKYKKIDWNSNNLLSPEQGYFVYGERDGVNYIISPTDGSEIGTYRWYSDARGDHHDVNYYPGKNPR